ncbi:MAG: OmpA family protein [Bacteroidetes bacterium]|nr:OmpA family protein [Bacteroidota bacterium]
MSNALSTAVGPRCALLLPLLLAAALCTAQLPGVRYTTTDKRAIKLYESGADCMRLRKWDCAEGDLKKAAQADPKFIEPRLYLGEMYEERNMAKEAMAVYKEVLAINPSYFPPAALHLAELELAQGLYAEAGKHFAMAKELDRDPQRRKRAELGLADCAFAEQAVKHPVPFDPVNLGPGVNTADPEYFPCVTADDSTLMFTRLLKDQRSAYGAQEDFFVSHKQADGTWGKAQPVTTVNTVDNEGAGTLTPDGRFIIFTKCAGVDGSYGKGIKGLGSCDLFISRRVGDRWTQPQNLGAPVNSVAWESQPSMGSDGRTLYFIRGSRTAEGRQNTDIYVTRMGDDGAFSKPERLSDNVNSPGREESVQIHPDGKTLYFSSDGRPGMGGLDIYMSRMQPDGTWGPALNLGWPINTSGDENSILVNANGQLAYFASDRPGGYGDLDLYGFVLYPEARPTPVSYIRGKVTDKATGKPLEADVELYDLTTGKLSTAAYSDPVTGEFLVCLPTGVDHALNASSDGYLFYSRNYRFADMQGTAPYQLDVKLSRVAPGQKIELRNIFFATASYALLPASTVELDKLVQFMKTSPAVRIEVGGHTDNVGKDAANQLLSEQRARSVKDFLVAHGIDGARVVAKGYGATVPVASNDTEPGRAQNRRTEVTVL